MIQSDSSGTGLAAFVKGLVPFLTLIGGISWVLLGPLYDMFYNSFGITPKQVGLDRPAQLYSAGGWFLLVVAVFGIMYFFFKILWSVGHLRPIIRRGQSHLGSLIGRFLGRRAYILLAQLVAPALDKGPDLPTVVAYEGDDEDIKCFFEELHKLPEVPKVSTDVAEGYATNLWKIVGGEAILVILILGFGGFFISSLLVLVAATVFLMRLAEERAVSSQPKSGTEDGDAAAPEKALFDDDEADELEMLLTVDGGYLEFWDWNNNILLDSRAWSLKPRSVELVFKKVTGRNLRDLPGDEAARLYRMSLDKSGVLARKTLFIGVFVVISTFFMVSVSKPAPDVPQWISLVKSFLITPVLWGILLLTIPAFTAVLGLLVLASVVHDIGTERRIETGIVNRLKFVRAVLLYPVYERVGRWYALMTSPRVAESLQARRRRALLKRLSTRRVVAITAFLLCLIFLAGSLGKKQIIGPIVQRAMLGHAVEPLDQSQLPTAIIKRQHIDVADFLAIRAYPVTLTPANENVKRLLSQCNPLLYLGSAEGTDWYYDLTSKLSIPVPTGSVVRKQVSQPVPSCSIS